MDKNKTNVLRSSRIIKINKAFGDNNNTNSLSVIYIPLSVSQPEEVKQLLEELLKPIGALELQNSDKQIISIILQKTAQSIKGSLQEDKYKKALEILKTPGISQMIIQEMLQNLSVVQQQLRENLANNIVNSNSPNLSKQLRVVLNKLIQLVTSSVNQEIQKILLLIAYYFSK